MEISSSLKETTGSDKINLTEIVFRFVNPVAFTFEDLIVILGLLLSTIFVLNTRTFPEYSPFPSLRHAPIDTVDASDDKDTDLPNWSSAASPSISVPNWFQDVPSQEKILAWPASVPFPSFKNPPIAIVFPSADKEIEEYEDISFAASPSISDPNWIQEVPFQV